MKRLGKTEASPVAPPPFSARHQPAPNKQPASRRPPPLAPAPREAGVGYHRASPPASQRGPGSALSLKALPAARAALLSRRRRPPAARPRPGREYAAAPLPPGPADPLSRRRSWLSLEARAGSGPQLPGPHAPPEAPAGGEGGEAAGGGRAPGTRWTRRGRYSGRWPAGAGGLPAPRNAPRSCCLGGRGVVEISAPPSPAPRWPCPLAVKFGRGTCEGMRALEGPLGLGAIGLVLPPLPRFSFDGG